MEAIQTFWRKWGPWLLLALLAASLVPILLLGRYDWPSADDYIYAYLPHEALLRGDGFWGEVWHTMWGYYKSWQGTFTALALMALTPLTFSEYLDFRGMEWFGAGSAQADLVRLGDGGYGSLQAVLDQYRRYGGLPFLALSEPDPEAHRSYMRSLYDTVIVRDILERERRRGRRQITNPDLLRRLCSFLADNVGNESSVNSIAGTIRAEGLRTANDTVDAYLSALREAYLFYRARRYDIRGKELLKTGGKHYVVDVGLRSFLGGYRDADQGRVFENIVYLQLLYDGYEVSVGKLRSGEVDFVATRGGERVYVQVTEDMTDPATMERELAPLRAVRDAWPKVVVTMRGSYPTDVDGIRIVSAADFLLHRRR